MTANLRLVGESYDDMDRALAATIAIFYEQQEQSEPWVLRAACRGDGYGKYFPERGQFRSHHFQVCGSCPVRDECLEYSERMNIRFGVWGGVSDRQRRLRKGWAK